MAVQVMSPENFLKGFFNHQPLASRPMNFNQSPNANRVARTQPHKKIWRSNRLNSNLPPPVQKTLAANKLVMGQVKILKRGVEISKATPNPPAPPPKQTPQVSDLGSTTRVGPEPKLIQKLVPKETKTAEPKPVQQQTKTAEHKPVQNKIKAGEPMPVQKRTKIAKVKLVPNKTKLAEPMPAAGFYAGSAYCIISPDPSSVPLPSFFAKKSAAVLTPEKLQAGC